MVYKYAYEAVIAESWGKDKGKGKWKTVKTKGRVGNKANTSAMGHRMPCFLKGGLQI